MDDNMTRDYITFAKQLSSKGCYSKAFELYILAFEKNTSLKEVYESEFRLTLTRLNAILAAGGKMEEIFSNFNRAMKTFPDNTYLLNDIGKYLYKYGFYTDAWGHFQKALRLDSGFVNAEKNLNSIKNLLVERWHFRMLNDCVRNKAYQKAIHETVIPYKDTVLDIGTGTGLLSLYAAERFPKAITACDGSDIMCSVAEQILEENGRKEIGVVNNMSTNIDISDIGGKRSIVVTEMYDAGLFGEHVIQALAHAKGNLVTDEAQVIPNKAEFYAICANSDTLFLKYQLGKNIKTIMNIPNLYVHIITNDENYDSEDVHFLKDLKYMTDSESVLTIDFNEEDDLEETFNSSDPYKVTFKAVETGEINVVIGWFNLYLTKNVSITTDPRCETRANAWQQVVFYNQIPRIVEANQTFDLQFSANIGKLRTVPYSDCELVRVSPETLRFLNDSEYMNLIVDCLGIATVYLGQMTEMSQITIADLCPFPFFGLLMLKRGVECVTCCAKTKEDEDFFLKVLEANDIPASKLNILHGDDWEQEVFKDERYHAVFCNILEMSGDIDLRMKKIFEYLKNGHIYHGGLVMPYDITFVGLLVESHWLDINNRVYDENVNNYKIAKYVNQYQVSQNFFIDFSTLEYTALTAPVKLGKYSSGIMSEVINVQVETSGKANAILCWYEIEMMQDLGDIVTNRSNSFIDGTAFLANPPVHLTKGDIANILRCVDHTGAFKLVIDAENPT